MDAELASLADGSDDQHFETIDPIYLKTDVHALIHARTMQDIQRLRKLAIRAIWKCDALPSKSILLKNPLPEPAGVGRLRVCEKLIVEMECGFRAVLYHLEPENGINSLMIYHQGHSPTWVENGGQDTVEFFLRRGYGVLICMMPMAGENTGPASVEHGIVGAHDDMAKFETREFNPLSIFVEPITVAINHLQKSRPYSDIGMIGISGGGWTTHLYAALDERIRLSFPVAGSCPAYLRQDKFHGPRDAPDWEQSIEERIPGLNYLDLYIMGASGRNRVQLQVINKFDSCCFAGIRFRTYAQHVAQAVRNAGDGAFDVFLDDTHRDHLISKFALETGIAPWLATARRP